MLQELDLQKKRINQDFRVGMDNETLLILNTPTGELLDDIFSGNFDNPFLLRGSGFSMEAQVMTWINEYRQALSTNGNLEELRLNFIKKTKSDVVGFYFEYLSKQDIFPIEADIRQYNEARIVFAPKYDKELKDLALPQEREGALQKGVEKAVEIILESGPNTIVILDSPPGWSGWDHEYPDNQAYVYFINSNGDLEALTIRTDLNLSQSENLISSPRKNSPSKERIKQVVSSPITIQANNIEAALDLLEEASGKKFTKQREEIKRREDLFTLNGQALEIVESMEEYLLENVSDLTRANIRVFVNQVGKAILDLYQLTLATDTKSSVTEFGILYDSTQIAYDSALTPNYSLLSQQVSQIAGCNGGGGVNNTSVDLGYVSNMTEVYGYYSTKTEWHMGLCNKCKEYTWVGGCNYCQPCVDMYFS